MGDNQYDPEVNKRLELVRKQFQRSVSEQKKQKAAERGVERRQKYLGYLEQNKVKIGRIVTYTFLALLVLAVIGVVISVSISS